MSKQDFGKIVSALRKEYRNEFDQTMTQIDLADLTRLPLITLQKIEQGRQANIKPDAALSLANALNLPTAARQGFLMASLGLDAQNLISNEISASDLLTELNHLLAQHMVPAYLATSFGDLISANPLFFRILDIDPKTLSSSHMLCKHNINRLFYSPEFTNVHSRMGESYAPYSRRNVLIFKALSLKYRNHWYLQKLLPELNRFPKFRQHWQSSTFHDEDIYMLTNPFSLAYPGLGKLNFLSTPIQALAGAIDLYLVLFQPLDIHTVRICLRIIEEMGTQPVSLSARLLPPEPKVTP